VDIHELIIAQRRRSQAPQRHGLALESVLQCGYAFEISEEINAIRASYQLSPASLITAERVQVLLGDMNQSKEDDRA
jgi:hypothetical protein